MENIKIKAEVSTIKLVIFDGDNFFTDEVKVIGHVLKKDAIGFTSYDKSEVVSVKVEREKREVEVDYNYHMFNTLDEILKEKFDI